ncbi:Glycosyltransferase, catalytic subunit of cellulose synthase and poly-beta-1,6-N-acetylglucosamine synthase [Marivirga sericea]|uniref:Glycosyltransferase, catalytic subunit of cellulose synthase and poly-beta-1,6-N-acetylglucosamine synthase n=1 Tax=Marivirga sericea TaxID=1028 RepID=A0A1X7KMI8_9BACT|nr:glycosyltransferase family 2 protein [Marivirga sericea]SMG41926.1 Glycosyltransferase, catalytic subunit of cellulose synthase and poly-beta-1,6-N-acetylglucosamine synthase [Marivirga sericea]
MIFLHSIEFVILTYSIIIVCYTFFFMLLGYAYKKKYLPERFDPQQKIAVFIPAYKEDGIIVNVVRKNLEVHYPSHLYDLIVIADSFKAETLRELRQTDAIVHEVSFEKSTKAQAINNAIAHFEGYSHCVILDADNVMDPDFLNHLSFGFDNGMKIVQGRRCAKNSNSSYSILDGINEEISNFIYRRGAESIGLSGPLTGSGMGFDYKVLEEVMKTVSHVGEDKELQLKLTQQRYIINYIDEAIVFDEKVGSREVFQSQRKRWLSVHFYFLRKYFFKGFAEGFRGNKHFFNMSVLIQLHLPRLFNVGIFGLFFLLSLLLPKYMLISPLIWGGLLVTFILSLFLSVPKKYFNKHLFYAILRIPIVFFTMLLILFKMKESKKGFIHTPHKQ